MKNTKYVKSRQLFVSRLLYSFRVLRQRDYFMTTNGTLHRQHNFINVDINNSSLFNDNMFRPHYDHTQADN
jgi:hypothetical protein